MIDYELPIPDQLNRQAKGRTHGQSKLSIVKEIKSSYAKSEITTRELAKLYSVSQRTICRVINNNTEGNYV